MPSTSSANTVEVLQGVFACFGLPKIRVSDNGTAFTSGEFQSFILQTGIKHRTSAPGHPASNRQAERYVYTMKQAIRAMAKEPGSIQQKLDKLLFAYRRAPHATTGESPAKLMLNRELRSALDLIRPNLKDKLDKRNDSDQRTTSFKEGEKVAVRNYRSPNAKWEFGRIISVDGPRNYTIDVAGNLWRRHANQIRRIPENVEIVPNPTTSIPVTSIPQQTASSSSSQKTVEQPTALFSTAQVDRSSLAPRSSPVLTAPVTAVSPARSSQTPPQVLRRSARVRRAPIRFEP